MAEKQVIEQLKQEAEWLQSIQHYMLPKPQRSARQNTSQNTSQNMQGVLPLNMSPLNGELKENELDAAGNWQHYDWRLTKRAKIIGLEGVKRAKQALHAGSSSAESDNCMPGNKFEHKAA